MGDTINNLDCSVCGDYLKKRTFPSGGHRALSDDLQ